MRLVKTLILVSLKVKYRQEKIKILTKKNHEKLKGLAEARGEVETKEDFRERTEKRKTRRRKKVIFSFQPTAHSALEPGKGVRRTQSGCESGETTPSLNR